MKTTVEVVYWQDHEEKSEWSEPDDYTRWSEAESTVCVSVGFLTAETDKHIILTGAMHDSGMGAGQKILKSDIVYRETVRTYKTPLLAYLSRKLGLRRPGP